MSNNKHLSGVDLVIGLLLMIVIISAVLPETFSSWFDAPYYEDPENPGEYITDWPGMLVSIWELIPLFAVLALAMYVYQKSKKQ